MNSAAIKFGPFGLPGIYVASQAFVSSNDPCECPKTLGPVFETYEDFTASSLRAGGSVTSINCGGMRRRMSSNPAPNDTDVRKASDRTLTVFLTSDYPLAFDEDEPISASAQSIQDAAIDLQKRGHDVVVIAPGYEPRPVISSVAPFPIRTMLFRREGEPRPSGGLPFLDFDIPLLGSNSYLSSSRLFSQLSDVEVDRLMMGYMAMIRFTSLIFGEPDVVVSSHVTSPWNYAASNYPVLTFVSSSDVISRGTSEKLRSIMIEGAKRLYGYLTTSWDGTRRLSDLGLKTFLQYEIPCDFGDFDVSLVQNKESTDKGQMREHFPQLKNISEDARWVVLYDKSRDANVLRYFVRLASEIERKDPNTVCIIVGKYKAEVRKRIMKELKRTFHVTGRKKWQVQRLIGASESAIIFDVGGELPQMDNQDMQRDLWIASQLAVVTGKNRAKGPKIYLPGRVDKMPSRFIREIEKGLEDSMGDYSPDSRRAIIEHLREMKQTESWKEVIISDGNGKRDASERSALREVRYAVRALLINRIVDLASGKKPDQYTVKLQPRIGARSPIARGKPEIVRWRFMDLVEQSLRSAAGWDKRVPAKLVYDDHEHSEMRRERLGGVEFDMYLREAFEDMVRDIGEGKCAGPAFRRWEQRAFRKLFTSELANPALQEAMPDHRRNANGVFSELARFTGVNTSSLFRYMAIVEASDPTKLISKEEPEVVGNLLELSDFRAKQG